MNAARKPRSTTTTTTPDGKRGGLPEDDDDLEALAAAVRAADAAPARIPLAAVPPLTTEARDAAPAQTPADTTAGPASLPAAAAPDNMSRPAPPVPVPAAAAAAPAAMPASAPLPAATAPAPAGIAAPALPKPAAASAGEEDLPAVPVDQMIRQATVSVDATVAERFRRYQRREGRNSSTPSNAEVVFRAVEACEGRYEQIVAARVPRLPEGRRFGAAVPGRRPTSEARLSAQLNWRPTHGELADIRMLQKRSGAASLSAFINACLDEYLPGRPPAT